MKTVIVTGAGGFIGKKLTIELAKENTVYAVFYSEKEKNAVKDISNVIPIIGDLNEWEEIRNRISAPDGIDLMYHLAWGGISSDAYKDIGIQRKNIEMSISAAMLAKALKCRKFIFAGTNQEYLVSKCSVDGTVTEASVYGMCKLCARKLCHVLLRDKMQFCATAFTNVFGPGDLSKRTANLFIGKLLMGQSLDLIEGNNAYDWTYIEDAVAGLIAVGENGKNGNQYYIGSRVPPTFREILTKVRDILCPTAELNFGKYNDSTYTDYSKFDLDALYRDTGFECTADFRESILKTAEWVKKNLLQDGERHFGRIIVVGTGFSGSILARKIAEECGRKVDVIEKRPHIGGNMYDEYDEHGILVQKYGPHFLNTNKYFIIKFLKQYAELFPHNTKLLSFLDERYIRLPFNFQAVQELLGVERAETVINKLRENFPGSDRVPILQIVDCPDKDVSEFGTLLFEKAFRTYTSKMWGTDVNKIDKYVLERVPFAMNYDERYLNKDFQYLPKNGFTEIFRNMLDHPNINVQLNTDALQHIEFRESSVLYDGEKVELLVFTGPIDELFGYKYGNLPYRSLDIRYEYSEKDSVLPAEIISFPQAKGKTRSTEYRKIMFDDSGCNGSVVATEYPLWYDKNAEVGNIPYYPVVTEDSGDMYVKYLAEAEKYGNIVLCGRLAEFKYYNMDVCIEHALQKFEAIKKRLEKTK